MAFKTKIKHRELYPTKSSKLYKIGDEVSYNVVDEEGFYNVSGDVIRVHKNGTIDVNTGFKIDKYVEPAMVEHAKKFPAGIITLYTKKKKNKR
jgi:hypothetical protein